MTPSPDETSADQAQSPPSATRIDSNFYYPGEERDPPGSFDLRRIFSHGKETFVLLNSIEYRDPQLGETFIVPNPDKPLETDMASIPEIFTWLVPKSGEHLPAAIIHDGMIPPGAGTYLGPKVSRQQADRIFRDGMRDLGTGRIRRWLVWTAVAFFSEWADGTEKGVWKTPRGWGILAPPLILIGTILLLGTMATIDLFDRVDLLPWMGSRTTEYELLVGGVFALVVPAVLSLLFRWRHMIRAALILGIAMALLLHVTAIILLLYLFYRGIEAATSSMPGRETRKEAVNWFSALGFLVIGLLTVIKFGLWLPHGMGWTFKVPYIEDVADEVSGLISWTWDWSGWLYLLPLAVCVLLFLGSKSKPNDSGATSN